MPMNEEQINSFPEAIREWDEVKNSDSPEVFWDRMTNMRSKLGTGLYKPGEDAGDEDWSKFINKSMELSDGRRMPKPNFDDPLVAGEFYASMGRPEEASGYEFAEIENAPLEDARKKLLSDAAFEAGISKAQLKAVESKIREADYNEYQTRQEEFNGSLTALKQEWGMATEERIHMAKKVVGAFFPDVNGEHLSAAELRSFYSLAKQLGTGTKEFANQGDQHNQGQMTPDEIQEKISEIRANKDHPYNNPRDPGHLIASKKMRNLYLAKQGLPME